MLPPMPDATPDPVSEPPRKLTADLVQELLALTARAVERSAEDPFGNPVLSVGLAISRQIDTGALTEDAIEDLVRTLRDAASRDRADRIGAYVGGTDMATNDATLVVLMRQGERTDLKPSANLQKV